MSGKCRPVPMITDPIFWSGLIAGIILTLLVGYMTGWLMF